jgi:hypothetical protein
MAQASKTAATTTSTSSSNQVIVFNYKTKLITSATTVIPFDRRFYFEIDSIPNNNITNIAVYSVKYVSGLRIITDSVSKLRFDSVRRSSFKFMPYDTAMAKNVLTLHFPALKPNQDFDILITKKFSPNNVQKALSLNKAIDTGAARNLSSEDSLKTIPVTGGFKTLGKQFKDLARTVNNQQYNFPKPVSFVTLGSTPHRIDSLKGYKKYLYDPLRPIYDTITGRAPGRYRYDSFLHQQDLNTLATALTKDFAVFNRLYILQKIITDQQLRPAKQVLKNLQLGLLTVDYNQQTATADFYDLTKRIKNVVANYKFVDSLYSGVLALQEKNGIDTNIVKTITSLHDGLSFNKDYLTAQNQALTALVSNTQEGLWVVGQNTVAQDLQTLGTRIFTIDAGLANIWTYNRNGTFIPLLKLTIGFDFYFRSIDKNVDFKYIRKPDTAGREYNHYLETNKQDRFALSVGLTLGSMGNKDFDNVYGTFSFTFGGSYVLFKGVKISTGVALLKRYETNPLLASQKSLIAAPYIGLSADYDLIGVISNFTSQLFK